MASIAGCSERYRFATEPNPHSGLSQIEVERLHLRGLEWAVGEWVDEGEGPEIDHVTFEWVHPGSFLAGYASYKWELYNIAKDYSEYNDLAAKEPDKAFRGYLEFRITKMATALEAIE